MDRRVVLGVAAALVLVLGAWIAHDPSSDVVKTAWRALPANTGWVRVEVPRWQPWRRSMTRRAGTADVRSVQVASETIAACGVQPDARWRFKAVLHLDGSPDVTVDDLDDGLTGCVRQALGAIPWAEQVAEGSVMGLAWSGSLAEVSAPWGRCFAPERTADTPSVTAGPALPAGIWRFDITDGRVGTPVAWPPTVQPPDAATSDTLLSRAPTTGTWRCFVKVEGS